MIFVLIVESAITVIMAFLQADIVFELSTRGTCADVCPHVAGGSSCGLCFLVFCSTLRCDVLCCAVLC